jgi:hypothetical protein
VRLLLAWTPAALPEGLVEELATIPGVEATTVGAGDVVDLVASHDAEGRPVDVLDDGWVVPLDALAIDPATYAAILPQGAQPEIAKLAPGQVVLSETSAALRSLGPGGRIELTTGLELEVAAVVPDTLVGAAEVVLNRADAETAGIEVDRFALLAYRGERTEIEAAVRERVPADVPVRLRSPDETPYLRHGDAVLPQAIVKDLFGEFAYLPPPPGERTFTHDPAWIDEHITTTQVPILGEVTCHRGIVEQLAGALADLEEKGYAHTIDPDQYAGCWTPRLVRPGGGVSRHAWGITVDLNADHNPTGRGSGQDPRLVETMADWGFTWGGFWLKPDPMHFEYLRAPRHGSERDDQDHPGAGAP